MKMQSLPLLLWIPFVVFIGHPGLPAQTGPCGGCASIRVVSALADENVKLKDDAVSILRLIVLGESEQVSQEQASTFGLPQGVFRNPVYDSVIARAEALLLLSRIPTADAYSFMEALDLSQLPDSPDALMRICFDVARRTSRMKRLSSESEQIQYLRSVLEERGLEYRPNSSVKQWARRQLCELGTVPELITSRASEAERRYTQYAEADQRICEELARLVNGSRLVNGNISRIEAYRAVLREARMRGARDIDRELARWAIRGLGELRTNEAIQALREFGEYLSTLDRDSPVRLPLQSELRYVLGFQDLLESVRQKGLKQANLSH